MPVWLDILLGLIVLSTVTLVITQNRHPVKTLAWMMVLIFLPVIGLVLYFFFGIDNKHRRLISDRDLKSLKARTVSMYGIAPDESCDERDGDLVNQLKATNMAIPLAGNDLRVYTDFDSMFSDMLDDMRSARDHIHFEFFKIEDDPVGREVEKIFIAKVREGVEVRVQYDDAANLGRGRFFERMRSEGVEVQPFLKVRLPFISSDTNYRNHRKLVVIDGRVGYMGGMNIAERYSTGIRRGVWRDTHIRVEGPAVSEMQTAFAVDWQFSSHFLLDGERYYPRLGTAGPVTMQVATSGPMDEWRVIMQGMVQMIASSREYVYVQSPYLVPTEPVLVALRNAALSGVDVRVMIPYRGDKGVLVPLASRSYVKDLTDAGGKVYFYSGGYMHSKTIVCDDRVSTIGSTNMDVRSYEQDFEINAFIYDRDVAVRLREAFMEDQQKAWLVDPVKWASRPWIKRYIESLARLLSPLL